MTEVTANGTPRKGRGRPPKAKPVPQRFVPSDWAAAKVEHEVGLLQGQSTQQTLASYLQNGGVEGCEMMIQTYLKRHHHKNLIRVADLSPELDEALEEFFGEYVEPYRRTEIGAERFWEMERSIHAWLARNRPKFATSSWGGD